MSGGRKTGLQRRAGGERATLYEDFRAYFAVFFGGFALCFGVYELAGLLLDNVGHTLSVLFWSWLAAVTYSRCSIALPAAAMPEM